MAELLLILENRLQSVYDVFIAQIFVKIFISSIHFWFCFVPFLEKGLALSFRSLSNWEQR